MIEELNKCLNCPNPRCQKGCPLNQDIRDFIQAAKSDLNKAREIIDNKSELSSFCCVVCPHDLQCEGSCVLGIKKEAVKIGAIEKYIVDNTKSKKIYTQLDKKILVIGGGPSGIGFAYQAIKHGIKIDLYEKESNIGGVPSYGIPNFRYDKKIYNKYIDFILKNANVKTNYALGIDFKLEDVINLYDYIYVSVGSDQPNNLRIDGTDLKNIVMSKDFLMKFNKGEVDLSNKDVVVIGAGNVAMDAARSANRANANKTTIVYRRTIKESTASKHEIDGAVEDKVIFKFLSSPHKFNGDDFVQSLTIEEMKLVEKEGERPYPTSTGIYQDIKCDYVILAIGQKLPTEISNEKLLEFDDWGNLITRSIEDKVFFGGDMINGPSSVAKALNDSNNILKYIIEKGNQN